MEISKTVLSEQIKDQLINDILSGTINPGERLVESSLTRRFGVSQSPVREALKGLEEMGFVTQEAYKGTTVRALTNKDIYEAFSVRAALESLAADLAAQRHTDEDIATLYSIVGRMEEAAKGGDALKRLEINNEFHSEIIRISGHALISKLSKSLLFVNWSRLKALYFEEKDSIEFASRHRKLIEAIDSGDGPLASKLMHEHIQADVPHFLEANGNLEDAVI